MYPPIMSHSFKSSSPVGYVAVGISNEGDQYHNGAYLSVDGFFNIFCYNKVTGVFSDITQGVESGFNKVIQYGTDRFVAFVFGVK